MLHGLLGAAGLDAFLRTPAHIMTAFAVGFIALDILITHGPFQGMLLALFRQDPKKKRSARRFLSQLSAKLVGAVFLIAVFPLAFSALLGDGEDSLRRGHRMLATNPTSQAMSEVAAGYFAYDIYICLFKFEDNGSAFLVHAVVCATVYILSCLTGQLQFYGAAFLMWELSTPFMYARWLLLKAGWGESQLLTVVNAAFMAVFFGCRNVWGPIMTWDFWKASQAELANPETSLPAAVFWIIRVGGMALNCLNTWWMYQMVMVVFKGAASKQKAV